MPGGRARLSSRDVEPLLIVASGITALCIGGLVLRSFGRGYRIGRLLAATPEASIDEALALAAGGAARYLRLHGRLGSEVDFPDEHERPLVFRRRRIEARTDGRWRTLDESREVVAFQLDEGLVSIAIEGSALDEGLVVLPRESLGTAADARDRVPADLPSTTPVRLRIEQLSAVEHATVVGVPRIEPGGGAIVGPGLGRPLIVSTLEPVEAMQLLAGGERRRPLLAAGLLIGGLGLVALGIAWAVARAVAG